jgi:putative transposase
VTEGRAPILCEDLARISLRQAISGCRVHLPFQIVAFVLLPDHLHVIWTMPHGDADYSTRWAWIKKEFTKAWLAGGGTEQPSNESRRRAGRRGVWQRRFWEHCIRDELDLERHCDYIHYNPVKHGLARRPGDWAYSTFHRFVRDGHYPVDWGCTLENVPRIDGEVWDLGL